MTVEEMKWFATLGVGGILAAMMFQFYRLDRKRSEEQLVQIVADQRAVSAELLEVVKQNTRAVQSLTSTIQTSMGDKPPRSRRKSS